MDRRLLALAAAVFAAAAATPEFPAAGIILTLVLPIAGIAGAAAGGPVVGALCLAPGAGILLARAGDAFPEYAASAAAGLVLGTLMRAGLSPARALAWGVLPFAVWTLLLAASGFDPVGPEMVATFTRVLAAESRSADPTSASLATNPDAWITAVRRTWVGAEIVFFAGALAVAYRIVGRLFPDRGWPRFAPFARFDLPDGLVGVALVGLGAAAAAQRGAPEALAVVGGNLLLGVGVLYAVRGLAIQTFWLARAGLGPKTSAALLIGAGLVLLPVFPLAAASVGLFDTWFDFRRMKGPEGGSHPLSVFRHSSSDDGT